MHALPSTPVTIYTRSLCPYCEGAIELLLERQIEFTNISIDDDDIMSKSLRDQTGQLTVPQIWIQGEHVGGYTDLFRLSASGELEKLLAN